MSTLDIRDIMDMLPHRYPFLLIDRIVELDTEAGRVVALKNVTANEPQFTGHFPGVPVMPGVLIIEAMAQACAIIALSRLPEGTDRKNSLFYFAGIDKARSKLGLGIFEAVARVDGKVVAQAEMMCAYRPVAPKTSDAGKQA